MFSYELACPGCGWRTVCGPADAVARLRLIGLLRREPEPDDELVAALFVEAAPRMTCPVCNEKSLWASPVRDEADGEWQAAVLCEVCRAPIPPERVQAVPDARRCAACQENAESAAPAAIEPEYCPKCGALVEVRVSRGAGITRYKRFCTGRCHCWLAQQ